MNIYENKNKNEIIEMSEFNTAMEIINIYLLRAKDNRERHLLLEYVLKTIKADIISSYQAQIFYKQNCCNITEMLPFYTYKNCTDEFCLLSEAKSREVNFESNDILTIPWKISRLANSVLKLSSEPFIERENNHNAVYYPIIDLCQIKNGYHSASAGKYYKNGFISAYLYDIEAAFENITTNGQFWLHKNNPNLKQPVMDYRASVLFEIAKK